MISAIVAAAFCAPCLVELPPQVIPVFEYVNTVTGHFVLLGDPDEMNAVDLGTQGPWERTGYSMNELGRPAPFETGGRQLVDVCRFYSPAAHAHFFTVAGPECEGLKASGGYWQFEGTPFRVEPAIQGRCAAGLDSIFRLHNNRFAFGDLTHRYTPDPQVRDRLIARGWVFEGVAWCAHGWRNEPPITTYAIEATDVLPAAECEARPASSGNCIAIDNLASMDTAVRSRLLPTLQGNPLYAPRFNAITGDSGDATLYTSRRPEDTTGIASDSFVQVGNGYGVHLVATDLSAGPLRYIEPYYGFVTAPPGAGHGDQRVWLWRNALKHPLEISFDLAIGTVRRQDAASHVYGLPVIRFRDTLGGQSFYFTVATVGTVPPADGYGIDAKTGRAIVATVFRADPLYGRRIAGDFIACQADASSGSCTANGGHFAFRIEAEDFARILATARLADPRLSADPEMYILDNFSFRTQSYLGAEAGWTVTNLQLQRSTSE
jgi:hypothetical protein